MSKILKDLKSSLIAFISKGPAFLLNTITPSSSYKKTKNVSFGTGPRDRLDIYRAKGPKVQKAKTETPVLIFIHGGAWDRGSKNIYKFAAEAFTQAGYDIVLPNYRLYPEAKFPNFLEDNAKAVAHTAKTFPGRPIVLIGHSAGGYNVLMLGLKDEFLAKYNINRCETLIGIVALSAPTGVIPLEGERLGEIFPDRHAGEDGLLTMTHQPSPPIFLGHGEADTIVNPVNATLLAEKITARGGKAHVKTYPKLSHIGPVTALSRYFEKKSTVKKDVLAFLEGLEVDGGECC